MEDAKYNRVYYKIQEILNTEYIDRFNEGQDGGVRLKSTLPPELNRLAKNITDRIHYSNLELAIRNLTKVVRIMAKDIKYSTSEKTTDNFKLFMETGYPFVVSEEGCNRTIFRNKEINIMARAWHDSYHYNCKLDFSKESEIKVCNYQIEDIKKVMTKHTDKEIEDVIKLIKIEVIGQYEYYEEFNSYLNNQMEFTRKEFNE
ncbi:MAG: hypothetical protein GQ570_08495 [Helicobacteraceae bacterium]|nr:hypothetical protein [Helicobacteraceae bacterium]